jgi:glycosyltransferase involved in cell wall biosynthesis
MQASTQSQSPRASCPSAGSANTANRRLKIAFLNRFDSRNRRSWSGIFHYIVAALESQCGEVVHLGPETSHRTEAIIHRTNRVNDYWARLTGNALVLHQNRILSKHLGKVYSERIAQSDSDVIFAPVASTEVANLETSLPIVYFSDVTWNLISGYYPEFSRLSMLGRAEGERIEASAIAKASAVVYPSSWALENACAHYHASRESAFIAPMGANLDDAPPTAEALNRSLVTRVNLLLVGVDWERKGGQIALRCLTSLLERGVDAELTVCGCAPPASLAHSKMRIIPRLDKRIPEQRNELSRLYREAHFMLFPTRAEAFGCVVCEASAHGVPTLAADTGGVRGAVRDGLNGFLFPYEAGGEVYADQIIKLIGNPNRYLALVASTRGEYERDLNWEAWGKQMSNVFNHAISRVDSTVGFQ